MTGEKGEEELWGVHMYLSLFQLRGMITKNVFESAKIAVRSDIEDKDA